MTLPEPEALFVSDLHLGPARPQITRRFLKFLEGRAGKAERLFILGDLFDVWVGDDDPTPPNRQVSRALRKLADRGTRIYLQHGNQDFLIGEAFARASGVHLLDDCTVIDLYGSPTLVMPGDLLCTDDVAYQAIPAKNQKTCLAPPHSRQAPDAARADGPLVSLAQPSAQAAQGGTDHGCQWDNRRTDSATPWCKSADPRSYPSTGNLSRPDRWNQLPPVFPDRLVPARGEYFMLESQRILD